MWFVFRALPEKRTTSPPSRERSERVTKYLRQIENHEIVPHRPTNCHFRF
ncbi:MAG: hypothetical protein U5L45_26760 [Saprospiraceae bacterium]|nr:hypothetical protein [Saprospiraceae bacterium]